MHRLVDKGKKHPTVIFLAEQLARKQGSKDYIGQAAELFKWVKANIHYVRDPRGVELLRSPFWTLQNRAGDCDDQAILFSALAEAIGFSTRFKTIKANFSNPSEFSHVYSQVEIPGKGWVSADTIVPHANLGWEAKERFGSQVWSGGLGMIGQFVTEVQVERELAGGVGEFLTEAQVKDAVGGLGQFVVLKEPGEIEGLGQEPLTLLTEPKKPNPWAAAFNTYVIPAVVNYAVGAIAGNTGTTPAAVAAAVPAAAVAPPVEPKKFPAWIAPAAVAGGAGLVAVLVMVLKRR